MPSDLTARDLDRITRRGARPDAIERQLEILRAPASPVRLLRPCSVGDGIARLAEHQSSEWTRIAATEKLTKFVPASGAASRMFAFLPARRGRSALSLSHLRTSAKGGDPDSNLTSRLLAELEDFPFFPELDRLARERDELPAANLRERDPGRLLELIADSDGLALAGLPKGLLPFHRYPSGSRTAFEEHVIEGLGYLSSSSPARFHFTVAEEHLPMFRQHAAEVADRLAASSDREIEVEFSVQDPATDTVAIYGDGLPLRDADGDLVFRPGGHGALLRNLQELARQGSSLVFVKNIDNVTAAPIHPSTVAWKRQLACHAVKLRDRAFELLRRLESSSPGANALEDARGFITSELAVDFPSDLRDMGSDARLDLLRRRLDRPLRVCGVVVNRGEPGGGPFWVKRGDEASDGQIVEGAQVERQDPSQGRIWAASTHFNPVDLVCSMCDRYGAPYDLETFIDQSTYFVSTKTHENREIKVLERPGLWNGAMAGWNTAFVEVPEETFAPVKTLLDLLRSPHRT